MKRNFSLILLLLCVAGFAFGLLHLFQLRFETGDVYPPYSTLRTDPLGASAFYESLSHFPEIKVSRDFRRSDDLPEGKNVAYLHLAGAEDEFIEFPEASFKKMDSFFDQGGRLVIAMAPETSAEWHSLAKQQRTFPLRKSKNKQGQKAKPDKSKKQDPSIPGEDEKLQTVSLMEQWGFRFEFKGLKQGENGSYEPIEVENSNEPSLPESVRWHGALVLTHLSGDWRAIYERDDDAVLAERKVGRGSVVIATDSYFLSNEAMNKDRQAALLAWTVGPCRDIYFDEAHLGIVDNPGVATLMRNYRLHGLMAGLLLLAGLFIWKNAVSLVPPLAEEKVTAAVAGKDSAAGFVNLLRRHIHPDQVLTTCVVEWKKSFGRGKSGAARIAKVEAILSAQNALPATARDPITTYRNICDALKITVNQSATRQSETISHHE